MKGVRREMEDGNCYPAQEVSCQLSVALLHKCCRG